MPAEERALADDIVRWDSALCAAACAFLRQDTSYLNATCCPKLTEAELAWLQRTQQPPIAAMQVR